MFIILLITLGIFGLIIFFSQSSINSFRGKKGYLINLYSSLLSDMNVDYRGMDMGNQNIYNIGLSITNFGDEVEDMARSITKESLEDQKWFISLLEEFHQNLTLWISRHTSELSLYEKEVEKISNQTSDESGKGVIRLSEKRIQNQIQIFQKI